MNIISKNLLLTFWGTKVCGFRGNPCPRIYILTNVYISICLVCIHKMDLATNEFTSPLTRKWLATYEHWPSRIKMIPQYLFNFYVSLFLVCIFLDTFTKLVIKTFFSKVAIILCCIYIGVDVRLFNFW